MNAFTRLALASIQYGNMFKTSPYEKEKSGNTEFLDDEDEIQTDSGSDGNEGSTYEHSSSRSGSPSETTGEPDETEP
ncbi:hypothetical protein C5167_036032 [Papaver somniferum]|nr:hypothetical protein C5167_036032 [Papaver somniferum]